MRRLALLTPDPGEVRYASRVGPYLERISAAFASLGVEAVGSPWTAPTPPDVDAAVPILSWGYHLKPELWRGRLQASGPPLVNPAAVLSWNTDKRYLGELEAAGVPTVPTLFVERADTAAVQAGFDAFGGGEIVVKPQVSAGAHQTARLSRGAPTGGLPDGPAMIQPFLSAVGAEGELSLFHFGGRFSHAVRKVASEGDFRIQPQFGGRLTAFDPEAEAHAVAEAAVAAAPGPLAYARVDVIRREDGRLAVMELEAIEPDLYADIVPEAAVRFAEAVLANL